MLYYDRNNKKMEFNIEDMTYLNHGECGNVYQYENMIFKNYFSHTHIQCRLNREIFDILKDIDDAHFIKIYEIYSIMSPLELILYKIKIRPFIVDAYIAKYYEEKAIKILYESIDYILDNFSEIERLFEMLAKESVCVEDIKRENTIVNADTITIIDPDCFYKTQLSKNNASISNKKKLLMLFRSICMSEIKKEKNYGKMMSKLNRELFSINVEENSSVTSEISKILKNQKRVIDYFC